MKKTRINFLEWNNEIFVSSIKKINLNLVLIVVLDIIFYVSSFFLGIFWLQRIQAKMASFSIPQNIMSIGYEKSQQLIHDAKSFYFLIIISFILLLVAIIFLASILKGIIWAKTTSTKISMKLMSKFLVLNLIWMGFWFVVAFLISYLVEPVYAVSFMLVTIALSVYFTNTVYTIFMKEQKLRAIFSAVKLNTRKIHLFLFPYFVITILFYVIIKISSLFNSNYAAFVLSFILIVFSAFIRYYHSELAQDLMKSKS